jgi:chromosome segregation ATPase
MMPHAPRGVSGRRHFFGGIAARSLGWFDGIRGGSTDRMTHELDKFKERAEAAERKAAHWWASVASDLDGEVGALSARIDETNKTESRLETELSAQQKAYDKAGESHSEARLREAERGLDRVRRERSAMQVQLEQARAKRKHAYQMARSAAEQHKDYYEGLMRAYCAANRRAPTLDHLPVIELPDALKQPTLDPEPPAPQPAAETA